MAALKAKAAAKEAVKETAKQTAFMLKAAGQGWLSEEEEEELEAFVASDPAFAELQAELAEEEELEAFAASDPAFAKLQAELEAVEQREKTIRDSAAGTLAQNLAKGPADARKLIEDRMAARRKDLASRLGIMRKHNLEASIEQLKSQIPSLTEQKLQAAKDLDKQREIAERSGNSSIEVEIMRAESSTWTGCSPPLPRRERLKVELRANPRITIPQRAQPPRIADNSLAKNALFAAILGLLTPLCLIVWWDVRARRINSLSDVPRAVGLTVIGTVPHIPGKSRRSRALSRRHLQRQTRIWNRRWTGSPPGCFCGRTRRTPAWCSSPAPWEVKARPAWQRNWRSAWRGPANPPCWWTSTCGGPRYTRFSACRAGRACAKSLPRKPNSAKPCGRRMSRTSRLSPRADTSRTQLGTLANGATGSLFERARQQYEFVIVDGSPILPIADARLASQHVDAVILCIRRDVSQIHKVLAACELWRRSAQRLVAVLTGSDDEMYYSDLQQLPATQGDQAATH